jgi:fibronectin type 3 domain-containing protein
MSTTNTLTWNENTEVDLAGYHVYRKIDTGPSTKINTALIPKGTHTYVDGPITSDGSYDYTVTAVDTAGNESLHSADAVKVVNVVPPLPPSGLTVA